MDEKSIDDKLTVFRQPTSFRITRRWLMACGEIIEQLKGNREDKGLIGFCEDDDNWEILVQHWFPDSMLETGKGRQWKQKAWSMFNAMA